MKTYLISGNQAKVHEAGTRYDGPQTGFTSTGDPVVKPPKAEPRLAIDDPLRVRLLKKPQGSDDEAEARFAKQRALIDAYKKENPGASTNKVFSELEKLHPSIFRDTDDDSEMDQQAKASHHVRWTRHAS